MRTILVTGGAGFIGTNLISDLLNKKFVKKIICIDNLSHGTIIPEIHNDSRVEFVHEDIRNSEIEKYFEGVDYVFHFAGLVSIYDCHKNPYEAFDNNIMGSIRVFDACIKHNVKKVIFSETSAMYEESEMPHCEDVWNPRTLYATSKACLHLLAESYRKTKNLTYTGLRYYNVYGKLQDWTRTVPPASCGFGIRLMQGKNPIVFGDGNRRRDFIHVDDVNRFHLKCLTDENTDNQVFNLGTGISISLYEMIDEIAKVLQLDNYEITHAPEIAGEAYEIKACIDSAKKLGWEPQINFTQGHGDLIRYLKDLYDKEVFPADFMDNIDISNVKI